MRYIFILIFVLLAGMCCAQTPLREKIPAKQFSGKSLNRSLKILNRKYELRFSYYPEATEYIVVPEMPDSIDIETFLTICLSETEFEFERIADTYVIKPQEVAQNNKTVKRRNFAISGIIRDIKTAESLPFASVGIAGTDISISSNVEGKFTLLSVPTDTSTVIVRYLGYKDLRINLYPGLTTSNAVYEMQQQERRLPSVQITALRQKLVDISPGVSQYNFNTAEIVKLPNLGENDLFAALRWLPGVSSSSDASAGLRIRGGGSDQNLVMFDGITVYHVDHFFGFLSAFNSNVVKNVQVNKGGFDARFGGRTSGFLEITGIDGNKKEPKISVEANMLSVNFLAELPIVEDKASLIVAYRRAYTTIVQSPTYRNIFNNIFNSSIPNVQASNANVFRGDQQPEYFYYDMNVKFDFQPSKKDALSFSYYGGQDDLNISFTGEESGIRRVSSDATQWGNQGGSMKWSRKWNKQFFTYANYGISRYRSNLDAEVSFFFSDDELFSRRFYDQRATVNDNTLRLDNVYEVNKNARMEFGYWRTNYRIGLEAQDQDFIFQDSIQSASLDALYAQWNQKLGKLTLQGGLRVSYYETTSRWYPEPRISGAYKVNDKLTFKSAFGMYTQMIRRLNERSLYFSIPETWALAGSNDVPVLRSNHYILGATFLFNAWEFDVEIYHKAETGTVEFLFPEFGISSGRLDQFALNGEKHVYGMDFLLKRSFANHGILFGYTYLEASSRYNGINRGNYFPSLGESNHELSVVYNFEWKRWDFSSGIVVASGQPYTPVLGTYVLTLQSGEDQQFISIGGINSERLDWYHRMDVSAGYTIPLRKGVFQAGISVYNVYNNLAVKFIDYFEIPEEDSSFYTLGRRDILSLGFTPSLFLKLKL